MLADQELGIVGSNADVMSTSNANASRSYMHTHDRPSLIELRGAILDVGIFKDTLLPSLALHSSLSLIAYGVGRYNNTVEVKDWLWPSAQIVNAWYSSVGRRVLYKGLSLSQALSSLSRPERLLLTGVTLWGGRLFYRTVSRSRQRGTKDDPRYEVMKKEQGFWDSAAWKLFLPEAIVQALVTLPFTAPFVHQGGVFTGYHPYIQMFSVGLFSAGLALETIADRQLDTFHASGKAASSVNKEGVWSIVRHPNYLGDALVHFSFPILLYASDMLAPVELLGPIANYLFLRYYAGDRQTEEFQSEQYTGEKKAEFEAYRADEEINSFWPSVKQAGNQWVWVVLGCGALGAGFEHVIHLMGLE